MAKKLKQEVGPDEVLEDLTQEQVVEQALELAKLSARAQRLDEEQLDDARSRRDERGEVRRAIAQLVINIETRSQKVPAQQALAGIDPGEPKKKRGRKSNAEKAAEQEEAEAA